MNIPKVGRSELTNYKHFSSHEACFDYYFAPTVDNAVVPNKIVGEQLVKMFYTITNAPIIYPLGFSNARLDKG